MPCGEPPRWACSRPAHTRRRGTKITALVTRRPRRITRPLARSIPPPAPQIGRFFVWRRRNRLHFRNADEDPAALDAGLFRAHGPGLDADAERRARVPR